MWQINETNVVRAAYLCTTGVCTFIMIGTMSFVVSTLGPQLVALHALMTH